ncbi:MAG: 1-acyl-sn-glycerol-3-phosphate acyltransferase [Bacteroidota bacterium]
MIRWSDPAYWLLHFCSRWMLRVLYPGSEVRGLERAKMKGPMIVTGNHPNTLMDPLFVGIFMDERLHFLAHAGLFQNKLLAGFLGFAGVVPIARAQDRAAGLNVDNDASFSKVIELLSDGRCLFIAPEGESELELKLRPLKSGMARIALATESNQNWTLGLRILPATISYESPTTAFSRAYIQYAEPILVADWKDRYEANSSKAIKNLTLEVDKRMRGQLIDTRGKEEEKLLLTLSRALQNDDPQSVSNHHTRTQVMLSSLRQLPTDEWQHLQAKAASYASHLRKYKLIDLSLSGHPKRKPLLGTLLGFPIFLWGLINHILIIGLVLLAEKLTGIIPNYLATLRGLVGWLGVFVFYPLQSWLVGSTYGSILGWLYFLHLPVVGLIALAYWTTYLPAFASLHGTKVKVELQKDRTALLKETNKILRS